MTISHELIALAQYMAGEFDNREQALADPAWYVHLRLWQRPLPAALFSDPSIALFAEQANILELDKPYRPRIVQLRHAKTAPGVIEAQYYMFKDIAAVKGAGSNPDLLAKLTREQIELLPGCTLSVAVQNFGSNRYRFRAFLPQGTRCSFAYGGQSYQVDLGFEAADEEFLSYDKGISPTTGKAIWGALMGPFRFVKRLDFASEVLANRLGRKSDGA
ncbi:chromophore lyase CpcT/CpeT [Tychonema sp. LEGE 07203]|uniref:chromophore lyase CpcT/CpeT n=1 Tax=Tychonema sp. LEGE 07203 TaxID=1828671 RepID=UPI0018809B9C|nr:chromophore lyase CpcT/CpeT [Tychonema sp. LEGE 07203]MBE9095141.1 chromophore lyase CpcT/CpeT [Tychonema sp. LEGE 07203]